MNETRKAIVFMDAKQAVKEATSKFDQAVEHFNQELKKIRTGRANAGMLDGVMVEVYGTEMPLNQTATVSAPEAQLLQITPFDPNNLGAISAAIRNNQGLGLNPSDDGHVVRVPIPPLTEERRREIVRQVGGKQEDSMIALRNIRHDAKSAIDRAKQGKEISQDEAKNLEKQVEEAMNQARGKIEVAAKEKETAVMTV